MGASASRGPHGSAASGGASSDRAADCPRQFYIGEGNDADLWPEGWASSADGQPRPAPRPTSAPAGAGAPELAVATASPSFEQMLDDEEAAIAALESLKAEIEAVRHRQEDVCNAGSAFGGASTPGETCASGGIASSFADSAGGVAAGASLALRADDEEARRLEEEQRVADLYAQLENLERVLSVREADLADATLGRELAEARAAGYRDELDKARRSLEDVTTRMGHMGQQVEDLQGQLKRSQLQVEASARRAQLVEAKHAALEVSLQETRAQLSNAHAEASRTGHELQQAQARITVLEYQLEMGKQQLEASSIREEAMGPARRFSVGSMGSANSPSPGPPSQRAVRFPTADRRASPSPLSQAAARPPPPTAAPWQEAPPAWPIPTGAHRRSDAVTDAAAMPPPMPMPGAAGAAAAAPRAPTGGYRVVAPSTPAAPNCRPIQQSRCTVPQRALGRPGGSVAPAAAVPSPPGDRV